MPGASAPPPGVDRRTPELEERKQREPAGAALSAEAREEQVEAAAGVEKEMAENGLLPISRVEPMSIERFVFDVPGISDG